MKKPNARLRMLISTSTFSSFLVAMVALSFGQSSDNEIVLTGLKHAKEGNLELAKQEFLKASHELYFLRFINDAEIGKIKKETAINLLAAKSLLFEGRFDDAVEKGTRAIQLNPNYAEAYVERSQTYFTKARYAPAWVRMKNQDGTYTLMNIGEKEGREHLLKMAIADGEEAIRIDPKLTRAYNALAAGYALIGDKEKSAYYENKEKELTKK